MQVDVFEGKVNLLRIVICCLFIFLLVGCNTMGTVKENVYSSGFGDSFQVEDSFQYVGSITFVPRFAFYEVWADIFVKAKDGKVRELLVFEQAVVLKRSSFKWEEPALPVELLGENYKSAYGVMGMGYSGDNLSVYQPILMRHGSHAEWKQLYAVGLSNIVNRKRVFTILYAAHLDDLPKKDWQRVEEVEKRLRSVLSER